MIVADALTKDYGDKRAVDDLSFTVRPGRRHRLPRAERLGQVHHDALILGLDAPTSGDVIVNGKPYREHPAPLHEVGALLEARSVHTGRSAYNHLLALAQTHGIAKPRVDELIDLVGLHEVARKRAGQFSLGMGQRLGIASALLGDPDTIILDEPVNGLDPEGIHWIRNLLKGLAAEGRTVFVSSHLMSEMALTADHLIVIGRGRLIADTSVDDFVDRPPPSVVTGPHAGGDALHAIARPGAGHSRTASRTCSSSRSVRAADRRARRCERRPAHELTPQQASLEEAFMDLTAGDSRIRDRARQHPGGDRSVSSPLSRRAAAAAYRESHPGARRPLGVDETLVASLDALLCSAPRCS